MPENSVCSSVKILKKGSHCYIVNFHEYRTYTVELKTHMKFFELQAQRNESTFHLTL